MASTKWINDWQVHQLYIVIKYFQSLQIDTVAAMTSTRPFFGLFWYQLVVNGGASFRWSFGPLFPWGSIESTTILTTHPSLESDGSSKGPDDSVLGRWSRLEIPTWNSSNRFDELVHLQCKLCTHRWVKTNQLATFFQRIPTSTKDSKRLPRLDSTSSRWPPSLYRLIRDSDEITIEKTHTTV